jgi:hypothetical protein
MDLDITKAILSPEKTQEIYEKPQEISELDLVHEGLGISQSSFEDKIKEFNLARGFGDAYLFS